MVYSQMRMFQAILCLLMWANVRGQALNEGALFIIGGGKLDSALLSQMVHTSRTPLNYIAVLPMASEEPDSAFYYFKEKISRVTSTPVLYFYFDSSAVHDRNKVDSLSKAGLIFITGGDQLRFMRFVIHSDVYSAIHRAFAKGATIAGTSAGAAVMSKQMITGNIIGDTSYTETFDALQTGRLEIKEGLGFLSGAIIDQHFIVRSRYNRLLSALAMYPSLVMIGIDESTAIVVKGRNVLVVGRSQVVLIRSADKKAATHGRYISMKNIRMDLLTAGDRFML